MITNGPILDSRRAREIQVVQALYRSNGMTRGELAEITGLGATVVVRLVSDLVERGVLTVDSKVERSSRGRPSELLRLDAAAGYVVGLEFGREQLVAITVDALGRVVHHNSTPAAPPFLAEEETVEALADLVRAEAAAAGVPWAAVRAAGLALHDVVNAEGEWLTQADLEGEALPIAARLQA
ncbi:MAG TPA: hypothetical protein VFD39_05090, partial [Trueperaceae bacterium]|nr:hypothetical protein [Trueperaceae bacterium]